MIRPVLSRFLVSLLVVAVTTARGADTADDIFDLDDLRVKIRENLPFVEILHQGEKVQVLRYQDPGHTIEPPYAKTGRDCPPFCIQPMRLSPGVETIGELELLDYLQRIGKGDDDLMVIDSRTPDWVAQGTIPGAANIPYTRLDPEHSSGEAIAELLELEFGVIRLDALWNFSVAKTLVFFCNGAWCGQSPTIIKALLDLGYPPRRVKWYRGGMQAWEQLGFTTVKPSE